MLKTVKKRPAPIHGGADMATIEDQLNRPLPAGVRSAQDAFRRILPSLLEAGHETHFVVVRADGSYVVDADFETLEEQFDEELDSGNAIMRGVLPEPDGFTLTFR